MVLSKSQGSQFLFILMLSVLSHIRIVLILKICDQPDLSQMLREKSIYSYYLHRCFTSLQVVALIFVVFYRYHLPTKLLLHEWTRSRVLPGGHVPPRCGFPCPSFCHRAPVHQHSLQHLQEMQKGVGAKERKQQLCFIVGHVIFCCTEA